jgi:hypothetical protein
MKKAVFWAAIFIAFLSLVSASSAADISGIWKNNGQTMNGTWGTVFQPVMGNWSLHRVGP